MSEFVALDTQEIAIDQKKSLQEKKEYLDLLNEQYINVNKMLINAKNQSEKESLKQNLQFLSNQISNTIIAIELLDTEFKKNAEPVLDDVAWKKKKLLEHWKKLEEKLKNSQYKHQPQFTDKDIKDRTKTFQALRKLGPTANVYFGGRKKSKRNKRMGRKSRKLMCPKNCCGVSVSKCGCPKSCRHCNCHEIKRLRKLLRKKSCKKSKRKKRRKRKKTKRKRR
jgi:hypothetical protein